MLASLRFRRHHAANRALVGSRQVAGSREYLARGRAQGLYDVRRLGGAAFLCLVRSKSRLRRPRHAGDTALFELSRSAWRAALAGTAERLDQVCGAVLHGARVESPDIRAGMAMLIAALCADGTTEIGNVRHLDRGYERIDERLRQLGARITRVDDVPTHA